MTRVVLSACARWRSRRATRNNNPVSSIHLKQAATMPVLVASHDQWRRLEEALT